MAGDKAESEDKTEAPTQRRLQQAREEGQVPMSRELVTFGGVVAGAIGLYVFGLYGQQLAARLSIFLSRADSATLAGPRGFSLAWEITLRALAPLLLITMIGGIIVSLAQSGGVMNTKALRPNLNKINPLAGFKRMFGVETVIELVRSVIKAVIAGVIIWQVGGTVLRTLPATVGMDAQYFPRAFGALLLKLSVPIIVMQGVIAAADVFLVRYRHTKQLRMSRQDIRDELRDSDGDPRLKAKLRQIRMQRQKKRMMAAVPKATVVITNPTHYAVALVYDRSSDAAPRMVAKGVDAVAARIREVATDSRVPVVSNPPLARALYRLEVDRDIPPEHYQAVAEIIAYVWRLRAPRAAAPQ